MATKKELMELQAAPGQQELLTVHEMRAIELTAELSKLVIGQVIGQQDARAADVAEFVGHIHVIQRMIMSQAAARAYPDKLRLLGNVGIWETAI